MVEVSLALVVPGSKGGMNKETRFWGKEHEAKTYILSTCKCNRTK